jgi:hypothetical protein
MLLDYLFWVIVYALQQGGLMTPRFLAAKNGENKYIGNACRNCGCTSKWTINASCVQCSNQRARENVKKSREAIKEMLQEAKEKRSSDEG